MTTGNRATLSTYVDTQRQLIEEALSRYLPVPPDGPTVIDAAIRYSLFAGGKRLRPILTLAAAEEVAPLAGTTPEEAHELALPTACALEMIHTYSLVHDDLPAMDNDSLRRGRPTLHVVHNDGLAILAGDGLLTEAFGLLARDLERPDLPDLAARQLRVVHLIASAAGVAGMVGGQAIDLQALETNTAMPAAALEDMHRRKTGALLRASAVSGAVMAGADDATISGIDTYATHLGLAFQIVDDILDVSGESQQLGKTAGKDAAAGKPTYPSLFGLDESRRRAERCLQQAHDTLAQLGLADGRLAEIADWVVRRTS